MELHLPPSAETRLNDLAKRTHRGTDELLAEAVEHLVTYNEWLDRKVKTASPRSNVAKQFPTNK